MSDDARELAAALELAWSKQRGLVNPWFSTMANQLVESGWHKGDPEKVDLNTARAEYARWFVKRHYLQQQWESSINDHRWEFVERQGYIRFYRYKRSGDDVECTADELEPYGPTGEKTWYRLYLTDLDLPINDHSPIAQKYRKIRQADKERKLRRYLLAEAEFHVVHGEAWLRAYGVDTGAL